MKKVLMFLVAISVILINSGTVLANQSAGSFFVGSSSYQLNGDTRQMDAVTYIKNNRTYVPVRYLSYVLGITDDNIVWDSGTQTVTLLKDNTVVQLKLDSNTMLINGESIVMDVAPEVNQDRTMLPAAWIAQAFGQSATYEPSTQTINITGQQEIANNTGTKQETITYTDGSKYAGETKNGLRDGQGTCAWADGSIYNGTWVNDERSGIGTMFWVNGDKYNGNWEHDIMSGQGILTTAKYHMEYTGNFRNNAISGQGTLVFPNGMKYIGEFENNEITGNGMLYDADGNIVTKDGDLKSIYNTNSDNQSQAFIADFKAQQIKELKAEKEKAIQSLKADLARRGFLDQQSGQAMIEDLEERYDNLIQQYSK